MLSQYTSALCREYTIPCPACSLDNSFPRLKRDIFRARTSDPDGHPLEARWGAENVEIPIWITPLSFFWAICPNCFYAGQVDDTEFRTWKKNAIKFKNQFQEGILENLAEQANAGQGFAQTVGRAMDPNDVYGTTLIHFFLGIHSEYFKKKPAAGALGRFYLRIAWLYRDQERLFQDFSGSSDIQKLLKGTGDAWNSAILSNGDVPVPPQLNTDELGALRQALTFFELNFSTLQSAGVDDEMRLMSLIAEIAYRIYELSGIEKDFTKAQSCFSGTMQKCLSVVNDKSIVGGAVNRAKDTLEKTGDRARELRTLQTKWEKTPPGERPVVAIPPPPKPAPPKAPETPEEESKPEKPAPPPPSGDMAELQQKVVQLDEENKRWMRLAGFSEVTGLPNRVMLSRVLLPGAFKQALAQKAPIGCIFLSPDGLREINGRFGRAKGDAVLKNFSNVLKKLLRKGERLCHLDSVNFAVVVPQMSVRQLQKRAESIHKDLTSRRFDLEGNALSFKINVGVASVEHPQGGSPKALQDGLLSRSIHALDVAKTQGNHIEVSPES